MEYCMTENEALALAVAVLVLVLLDVAIMACEVIKSRLNRRLEKSRKTYVENLEKLLQINRDCHKLELQIQSLSFSAKIAELSKRLDDFLKDRSKP